MLDRIRRRFASENAPATLVLGVLVATLALSGVLVHQAARAVRSQRAAAEGALRDYAAFAAWELGRRAEGEIARVVGLAVARGRADAEMRNTIAMRMLRDLVASRAVTRAKATIAMLTSPAARAPADALVAFAAAVRAELERFGAPGAASAFFRVDLTTGAVEMLDGELPDAVRQALVDTLRARASRSADPARLPLPVVLPLRGLIRTRSDTLRTVEVRTIVAEAPIAVVAAAGQPHSHVASSIVRALAGDTAEAFGFVVDIPAVARPVLRRIVDGAPLLPPSLTRGAPNAAVLAIDVRTRAGRPVLATGRLADAPVASDTLDGALSQLVARVAVRRDIADRLVIGGLPRSRLPLLAGLFALALGLTGVAVMQLRRQQQFARLRSDFVAGISHELRTPLAQIRLFSDLLESGRLDRAGAERSVRIIGEEARRLTYLVENVLRFSRAERSGDRIAPAPRQLAPLVREVADAFAPLARSADVALVTQLDPDIVAAVDADALRQILLNLLDNAVKYGPRGQRVTLGLARDGDFARLWVDDEGPGIPPADRARVWEPYRRLDRDIDRVTGGSGIGLAVVRSLVRLHGGDVAIADSPAGGARVVVRLPAAPAAASATEPAAAIGASGATEPAAATEGAGATEPAAATDPAAATGPAGATIDVAGAGFPAMAAAAANAAAGLGVTAPPPDGIPAHEALPMTSACLTRPITSARQVPPSTAACEAFTITPAREVRAMTPARDAVPSTAAHEPIPGTAVLEPAPSTPAPPPGAGRAARFEERAP